MNQNELIKADKQVEASLNQIRKQLKENQEHHEAFARLSREGQGFFQETLDLLRGSSDSYVFQGFYDEQVSLDKTVRASFEREYDALQQEQGRLTVQLEELSKERQKLEKEVTNGC